MTNQSTGAAFTEVQQTPGQQEYALFHGRMLKDANQYLLVWGDLHPNVQALWEEVARGLTDPKMFPEARAWNLHAAITNDPDMPSWDGLSIPNRVAWAHSFHRHSLRNGAFDPVPQKESEAMEQLRQMRGYSRCFTNAFDRKQAVFVLVEQDETAWMAIAQWIKVNIERMGASNPKIISAKATLGRFMDFTNEGKAKKPD